MKMLSFFYFGKQAVIPKIEFVLEKLYAIINVYFYF